MRNILLVAADSVRALLHRRLLLALMIAVLILTVGYSVVMTQVSGMIEHEQRMAFEAMPEAPESGWPTAEDLAPEEPGADEEQYEAQLREMRAEAGVQMLASFYGLASFGAVLVALFIGATALSGDIRSGAVAMVLSKPVSRWQFLLGKYFGALAVLLAYSAMIGVVVAIFTQVHDLDAIPANRYAPWLMFCQSLIYGSLALLLSTLMHPLPAGVLAFFSVIGDWLAALIGSENLLHYLHFLFPTYQPFGIAVQSMTGAQLLDWIEIGKLTLYALNLTAIYLLLAMWRFRSRAVT